MSVNNFPAHALPVLSDYARPQLVTTLISKSRIFSLTLLDNGDYAILREAGEHLERFAQVDSTLKGKH
jgi:hypothetical protein